MNKLKRWLILKAIQKIWRKPEMDGIRAFFAKYFSTDSIWSRVIRAVIGAFLVGGIATAAGGLDIPTGTGAGNVIHLPPIVAYLLGLIGFSISAGQNNRVSSEAKPKPLPPTA